ncbi:MAG: hypothetical protein KDD94_08545 [Calditrichaeota bacterium]|nr:hypothetical protein [Calditrichota bacterium]
MQPRIGKDIDKKQLGRELKDLIFAKGYTSIYDFHKKSAQDLISYTTLKQTISGRAGISLANLLNIAEALDMKPLEFFAAFSFKRIG